MRRSRRSTRHTGTSRSASTREWHRPRLYQTGTPASNAGSRACDSTVWRTARCREEHPWPPPPAQPTCVCGEVYLTLRAHTRLSHSYKSARVCSYAQLRLRRYGSSITARSRGRGTRGWVRPSRGRRRSKEQQNQMPPQRARAERPAADTRATATANAEPYRSIAVGILSARKAHADAPPPFVSSLTKSLECSEHTPPVSWQQRGPWSVSSRLSASQKLVQPP